MLARDCPIGFFAALRTTRLGAAFIVLALGLTSCRHTAPTPLVPADALVPSPRLIVGRITAIDAAQSFAFVEIAPDAPPAALAAGTEWIVRTLELQESGRLRTSRFVRGRILGTTIVAGQPAAGDEVVWLAP